jgi:hypothetical protein
MTAIEYALVAVIASGTTLTGMGKDRAHRDTRYKVPRPFTRSSAAIWLTVIFATWALVILAASRVMSL